MITVEQGQNLLDIAMQHCGDATAAYDIAALNGLSLTDELTAGQQLLISEIVDPGMVKFFADNNAVPATGSTRIGEIEVFEGIDYWAIEEDFIVS